MLTGATAGQVGHSTGRRVWAVVVAVAVAAALVTALVPSRAGPLLRPSGLAPVGEFVAAALAPRVDGGFLALTLAATGTTLGYAVLGTALSLAIGAVGGLLGSRVWWAGTPRAAVRGALVVPRGIHEVVWGLFLLSVLGIEPVVAVLAIAVPFGAITAKVFAEILDDADPRPAAALRAAGAGRAAAIAYGVLPVAAGELLSYAFYRFECAIRSAAILGLVGAGGLGFQLALSFSALRYDEIWTLLAALVLLGALADAWSSAVRRRLAGRAPRRRPRCSKATLPQAGCSKVAFLQPGRRDPLLVASLAGAAAAVPVAAWWVALDLRPLVEGRSWQLAGELFAASWPPTFGAGPVGAGGSGAGGLAGLVQLSGATAAMSVLAVALAFAGGLLLAGPAARPDRSGPARWGLSVLVRGLLVVLRSVPPPVWALLTLFVLAPGILPGAVALGVYTAGVLGRLMAETVENLDRRPLRTLRAAGASGAQVFGYGVLPAAAPRFTGYALYRWEVTVRETVVVGVVGAGGLGVLLQTQLALFDYAGAVTTIGALLVLTVLVDLTSAGLRRAVR